MKRICILAIVFCINSILHAQVGIGNSSPDPKAALDITATGKGLLIPRMDSATRVAIASPIPNGLMVFQTDQRKGFWYAVNNTWLYIPDKTQTGGDNLGSHSATQTLNLNAQQLIGFTGYSRGDSIAQVSITSYINDRSNALETRSIVDNTHSYTRSLLSGYGVGPANLNIDYGIWSHSYRASGWAVLASGGNDPHQSNHWVGLGQGPSAASLGATIRIVDGNQGAGKVLTSDALGNGTWQAGVVNTSDNQTIGGIKTFSSNLVATGFTQLGSNAPAIKTLELNGTLPASMAQTFLPHGLTDGKIMSITAMVSAGMDQIPPNFSFNNALYGVYIYSGQVVLQTGNAASSGNIYGKPIRIFIVYKE